TPVMIVVLAVTAVVTGVAVVAPAVAAVVVVVLVAAVTVRPFLSAAPARRCRRRVAHLGVRLRERLELALQVLERALVAGAERVEVLGQFHHPHARLVVAPPVVHGRTGAALSSVAVTVVTVLRRTHGIS